MISSLRSKTLRINDFKNIKSEIKVLRELKYKN